MDTCMKALNPKPFFLHASWSGPESPLSDQSILREELRQI